MSQLASDSRPRRIALPSLPIYPAALAAAFITTRFLQSVEPIEVLPRPLLVSLAVMLVLQGVATVVTRSAAMGAYLATVVLLILADTEVGFLVLGAGVLPLVLALRGRRTIQPSDWTTLTKGLNLVAVVVLAFNLVGIAGRSLTDADSEAALLPGAAAATLPDIHLLMLDGYPRADTLRTEFDFDNGPFLAEMEGLGFEVAEQAHANYNATVLTLASMLNMQPAQSVVTDVPGPNDDELSLVRAINDATGLRKLRDLGYRIVTVPSGISTFSIYAADDVEDTGQINTFEVTVARAGLLRLILPGQQNTWVHDQLRDRITASLARVQEIAAAESDRPRFVFTHVMSPHSPIVFGADGSPRYGWGCFPQACDPWADIYAQDIRQPVVDQLSYLNVLVRDAVAGILAQSSRETVVIVFSDHGRRHDLADYDEMLRSLFLSYTPGHPGLFPSDTTPINVLPRLLNAYADQRLPLADESSYVMDIRVALERGYLILTPWEP